MYSFEFSMPTKVIFGSGSVSKVGKEASLYGKKALLVTYDQAFIQQMGFLDCIIKSCQQGGLTLFTHFGVKSNPTLEHAKEGIALVKKEDIDVLIAVGGGSVIDEAKFIGIAKDYDGDPWDFTTGKAPIQKSLPLVAVVTIPATSSELNGTSVMSSLEHQRKNGFASPIMRPKTAILDPDLTISIPVKQTAYSAADIISHLLEHYFGHSLPWAPFQDHYCQGSIRTIIECMDRILINPADLEARSQMMWCASYAWNGFYDCGLGACNSNIHILGHSLSNFYDTPHGAAMSITILATMRFFLHQNTKKYANFAREVFAVQESDDLAAAQAGINALQNWFVKIGTPVTLEQAGITDEDAIEKMAADALETAISWGEGDNYFIQKCREMFQLCK